MRTLGTRMVEKRHYSIETFSTVPPISSHGSRIVRTRGCGPFPR